MQAPAAHIRPLRHRGGVDRAPFAGRRADLGSPISYNGRTYAEGKKIDWKDGVAALWHILRFNLFARRTPTAS